MTPREIVFMTDDTFYGEIWDCATGKVLAVMPPLDDLPEEFTLFAAAYDLLAALESIENDAGQIPAAIWEMRNAAIARARGLHPEKPVV